MQGKSKKYQSLNRVEWIDRLRLGSHAPAERFPAREQAQVRRGAACSLHRGAHAAWQSARRIRSAALSCHIGELEAQRRDPFLREPGGELREKRMRHPRARAVREHEERVGVGASLQESRHASRLVDLDAQRFERYGSHPPSMREHRRDGRARAASPSFWWYSSRRISHALCRALRLARGPPLPAT